jgi:hypothetical protein
MGQRGHPAIQSCLDPIARDLDAVRSTAVFVEWSLRLPEINSTRNELAISEAGWETGPPPRGPAAALLVNRGACWWV